MSACECSPCGRKFTGLTAFDKHQDVDYKRTPAVRCIDPATLGMSQDGRGFWYEPAKADARLRLQKMRASRTSPGDMGRVQQ